MFSCTQMSRTDDPLVRPGARFATGRTPVSAWIIWLFPAIWLASDDARYGV
jgi:hypothetical protein